MIVCVGEVGRAAADRSAGDGDRCVMGAGYRADSGYASGYLQR